MTSAESEDRQINQPAMEVAGAKATKAIAATMYAIQGDNGCQRCRNAKPPCSRSSRSPQIPLDHCTFLFRSKSHPKRGTCWILRRERCPRSRKSKACLLKTIHCMQERYVIFFTSCYRSRGAGPNVTHVDDDGQRMLLFQHNIE